MSALDLISDYCRKGLVEVPNEVLNMGNLRMLYLEGNEIAELPKAFFKNLKNLQWLDLRNNKLTTIPKNIAYHDNLENLLLANNKIKYLPNELGLIPKLRVLQISNNPLIYPDQSIVALGCPNIIYYLRAEYQKSGEVYNELEEEKPDKLPEQLGIPDDQKKLQQKSAAGDDYTESTTTYSEPIPIPPRMLSKGIQKRASSGEIVHKFTKGLSKASVHSYYSDEEMKSKEKFEKIYDDDKLKGEWMDTLKMLLAEQESILQQGRNLKALGSWRLEKKLEAPREVHEKPNPPPYGTDPQYNKTLSRDDLKKEIEQLVSKTKHQRAKMDVESIIGDIIGQLKEMQTDYNKEKTPQEEMDEASQQMKKVMELHKKLRSIQENAIPL